MKSLQFITHYTERYSYLDSARMALEGGCRWIQLRMKDAGKEEILPIATEIRKLCNDCGAIFIIDDHVELVREIRADGVHLGKNDMPIAEARRILGDEYIIGGTANTYEDVKKHWLDGVNYIGCGPFRYTTTKMGKGKGNVEYWVALIQPGKVLYEMDGVPEELAREAFGLALKMFFHPSCNCGVQTSLFVINCSS